MDDSGIKIRAATADDLGAIVSVWWQLMSEHKDRDPAYWPLLAEPEACASFSEYMEKLFDEAEHFLRVARIEGSVVGFIHGQVLVRPPIFSMDRVGRVVEISVDREFRGRGVGRALMAELEREFKNQGITCMNLMVDTDNEKARALYRGLGFYERELHLVKKL